MNDKQKVKLPVVAWMDPDGSRVIPAKVKDDPSSAYRSATAGYSEPLTTVAHAEQYARAMVPDQVIDEYDTELGRIYWAGWNDCRAAALAKLGDGK